MGRDDAVELFMTPLSHFSRKVRVVLEELGVPYEMRFVPDLLSPDPADYGGNPNLRVPVLRRGERWIVESDAIAADLAATFDRERDRLRIIALDVDGRNALAVIAGVMGAEVELLLASRGGLDSSGDLAYFARHRAVIGHGLTWLEARAERLWHDAGFAYLDVALGAMWDHLAMYGTAPLEPYPTLAAIVARHAGRESMRLTAPAAMLEVQRRLYPEQGGETG